VSGISPIVNAIITPLASADRTSRLFTIALIISETSWWIFLQPLPESDHPRDSSGRQPDPPRNHAAATMSPNVF
jgi:hypothetical protein